MSVCEEAQQVKRQDSMEAVVDPASSEGIDGKTFNINIILPSSDTCKLQVAASEIVQEIYRALVEREESCHRTCFSLQFDGQTLDLFADLKSFKGLGEGSEVRVVEEHYTLRDVRNHVKHIHDVLNSINLRDAYTGKEQMSLSFFSSLTSGDILERKTHRPELNPSSFLPPSYVLPNRLHTEPPLVPLHPISTEDSKFDCVHQLNYSNWNPPPTPRRLVGDLLYLVVSTLEGKRCHITACPRGFYVNQTTDDTFNPSPVFNACVSHSLVDLLKHISPAFKKAYDNLLKKRAAKHPLERLPTPYQVHSWLSPQWEHTSDSLRKEESFSSRMVCEENLPGQTRDWNDELQVTRELPHATLNDRLMRDRAVFKSNSDFVAAATRAAVSVVNGDIMAINPGETRKQQMFIWNNMFFSLGFDVKDHYKELGGDAAAYVATSSDLNGVRAYSMLDHPGLCYLGTAIIDYRGYRITAQTIIPGILEKEQEQLVVYGSIDFGKTVVENDQYKELLGKTAKHLKIQPHKVVDKSGKVVELVSSVDCKGIIGNDNRTYILDLLHTFPPDVNYLGGAPASCRPVLSQEMQALGYPYTHRHLLPSLRQELLDAFCESKRLEFLRSLSSDLQKSCSLQADKESTGPDVNGSDVLLNGDSTAKSVQQMLLQDNLSGAGQRVIPVEKTKTSTDKPIHETKNRVDTSDVQFEVAFNPDVYQANVTFPKDEKEQIQKDEALVREACEFLVQRQIPAFIQDCQNLIIMPQDGSALIELLHQRGINVRYLNRIINGLGDKENVSYLRNLAICEVLCRSAKHLFKLYLQEVDPMFLSAAVAHFLNCLLTACPNLQPLVGIDEQILKMVKAKKGKKRVKSVRDSSEEMSWINETPASFWTSLNKEVKEYYHLDLHLSDVETFCQSHAILRTQILRSFCQSAGIQLVLREYTLIPPNGARRHSLPVFTLDDIMSLYPIVKHLHPHATDAYNYFNFGQARISSGHLQEGFDLISEALNLLNTIYGPVHPDIGSCNRLLARLSYVMGEHQAALLFQQRATVISERVHGIDSPSTAAEYIHMSLYCFACGHLSVAFQLLYRARYLALLCHGESHPEIAQIDVNISLMLYAVEEFDKSILFLENSLRLNKLFYGEKSLKTAFNYHLISRTHAYRGDFRQALDYEKRCYVLYLERFGESSDYVRESNECLRTLTNQAVTMARQFQKPLLPNGEKPKKGVSLRDKSLNGGPTLPPVNYLSILDTLNKVNGIFYLQLNRPQTSGKETGSGPENEKPSTVEITPVDDETVPSSHPEVVPSPN